jgi:hypothetical protein
MKLFRIIPLACFLISTVCLAQQTAITVRLVNGKNGKAITDKAFNIWLGNSFEGLHDTDAKGEIKLDVTNIEPRKIRVLPDFRFDCRESHGSGGDRIEYSLDEILSAGVVGENLCGRAGSLRQPGVLVIFVRPRTLTERREL